MRATICSPCCGSRSSSSSRYKFIEFFGGDGGVPEQTGTYTTAGAEAQQAAHDRRAAAAQEAPPRPKGVVDLEEFDSTLYFLEEREINQVAAAVEDEYRRDVRLAALNVLFDLFELQGEEPIRGEILGALEALFPNFLNARDFRTAATVLRETRLLGQRTQGLAPAARGKAGRVHRETERAGHREPAGPVAR